MTKKFELYIFDWDGTLMDSIDHISSSLAAAAADINLVDLGTERYKGIIGLGLAEAMAELYPDADVTTQKELCDRYRHHFFDESNGKSSLFDGTHEMLASLKEKGPKMAVATGKARRGLTRVFDETGYHSMFHASRCADESGSKPAPHMLHEIMSELNVTPDKTLMIGDSKYDMQMANNAGVDCVAVSYGVHGCEELQQHSPLTCCENIAELSDWLHMHIK
ncbi:MAG: HAD-IIIA family hydrolase [Sulfuriflexus sp.]|nr:HAD-IIIA family hydrolase [Sulfuriflexus sp.]